MASSARRRMRDGFAAGQIAFDGLDVPVAPLPAGDEDAAQKAFAAHAAALEAAYAAGQPDPWAGSRYAWIRNLAPARRGKVGGQLVDRWLRATGIDVAPRLNAEHDRVVAGRKAEIKLSTLWTGTGEYTFQQLRDQDYELLILLGVSPERVHAWVLPKHAALAHLTADMGARTAGADARWLTFPAARPPEWLAPYGGPPPTALDALRTLTGPADPR